MSILIGMMSTTFLEAFESECHWDSNDLSVAAEELDSTFKKARMKLGQIRSAAEKRLVDRSEESARHSCQKLHYELMKLLNNVGFLLTS